MRKTLKATAAAALFSIAAATSAFADGHAWAPEGPIKLMIAFAAGGGADTQARLIAEDIEASLGWEVIPEQVTGKGGVNALVALKDMPADGSAIALVVTESLGYNAAAAKGAGIAPSDFTGLTTTAGFQMAVVAKADKGWTSFDDMIAAAKDGELRFGTMSQKLSDLAFLLGEAQGVDFNIVQVRGGRAVMDGVQAGDMDLGFMAGIQSKGVAAGDLVNLASALPVPLTQTPDAPTLSDLGVQFSADGYFVFVAPAGMDAAARDAITSAIVESTNNGKASGILKKAFGGAVNIQGAELDALLQSDFDSAGQLMEAVQ
ncbi:MAG: tripartite tricarboxylate transporter substrate-binding protein [Rhodobacteraceae bacterium]|nr:tripartite tricarboxylate transporter substrate-binding protein [Paracoccaceae bacterium]